MKHIVQVRSSVWYFLLLATFLITQAAQAQDKRITGKVIASKDKQPIPGVNILVRNTELGTTTDGDGNFTQNAPAGATLVFSSIGFAGQTISIGNQTQLTVTLPGS